MKHQTLTLLLIALTLNTLYGQRYPQGEGTFRTSGGFSFGPAENNNNGLPSYKMSITPSIGYFFSDEALIALAMNYSATFGKDLYEVDLRLSPSAKYYFIISRQKFITANFTYNFDLSTDTEDGEKDLTNNTSISFGPGGSYFFTRRIGIEATLLYTYYLFPEEGNDNKFSFGMGFNLNLPANKKKKTKEDF